MRISTPISSPIGALFAAVLAGLFLAAGGGFLPLSVTEGREIDVREAIETELLEQTRRLFWAGEYSDCAALCESGISAGRDYAFLRDLLFRSLIAEGKEELAYENFRELHTRNPESIPLLMVGYRVCKHLGKSDEAEEILGQVNRFAREKTRSSLSADEMVALGRAAFALGADPAKVLESYFRPARKKEKHYGLSYIAAAELALEKRDFAVAAREYRAGAKAYPGDPDMHSGLAAAFFPSNRQLAGQMIEKALSINPRHTGAMRLKAEHLIDAERYGEAAEVLVDILAVNPHHPEAWALSAVVALFENDEDEVKRCRKEALALWEDNPRVDYLIGKSLSRKRRFGEGAEYQRSALNFDEDFLPAEIQLAQDLLRLGREEEAWELVERVHARDAYHVVAFNLATLRDEMKSYATLANDDFILRMTDREAGIYGDRAMELLVEAKDVLCEKYGLTLDEPVLVEFFPSQQDFAVRTLGVPGGGGLLGVCFGSVITMNSPGSMAHGKNNWEATLWHEYCHVVTLGLTRNKMPRWLSEGISVYEELQRDPNWGQHMTPRYRELILEEEALRPVSEIGSMFMNPESGEELMFAYYESYLVVEFLMGRFGIGPMRAALAELGEGKSFEEAARKHFGSMERLERDFKEFAIAAAKDFGKGADWSRPEGVDPLDGDSLTGFLKKHPKNFHAMQAYVILLLEEERWKEAATWGEKLRKLHPEDRESGNACALLAKAYRELGDEKREADVLRDLASRSPDATSAILRLLELDAEKESWEEVEASSRAILAVNPFLGGPHYFLGRAEEASGEESEAITAYETVLKLGADKPAEIHYRLARLVRDEDEAAARKHVLDALVEAPRFREAQELLVELTGDEAEGGVFPPSPPGVQPPATPPGPPDPNPTKVNRSRR